MTAGDGSLVRRGALDPLADELTAAGSEAVRIEPVPFRTVLNLRGRATEDFAATIEAATGVPLPLEANRWRAERDRAAIWLGPDEWLLVAPDGEAARLEETVRAARPDDPGLSVADVSGSYTCLRISGSRARDVLAGGCSLDLSPPVFTSGRSAQTLLARAQVLMRALDDSGSMEIWVRNSFARYVARWLLGAGVLFRK